MRTPETFITQSRNNVLIVDDDVDDRKMIEETLKVHLCSKEYIHFDNGQKLLEYLYKIIAHQYPAFIILDFNMPIKNGEETLAEIKRHVELRMIPVVIFTTSYKSKYRDLYKLGANCVLQKPSEYLEVMELLKALSFIYCMHGAVD